MSLPQTLSSVNRAGIELNYANMFEDYRNTGLFKLDSLRDIGKATNKRYLAQLKLSGFTQGSDGRLGVFGLRVIKTHTARLRLVLQIWDSQDGKHRLGGHGRTRVFRGLPDGENRHPEDNHGEGGARSRRMPAVSAEPVG